MATPNMSLWSLSVLFLLCWVTTPSSAIDTAVFECPEEMDLIGSHCYYFIDVNLNFEDAEDVCENYGSKLVVIRDEVESHDVGEEAAKYFKSDTNFWIGNYRVGKHDDDDDDDEMNKTASMYGYWQAKQPNYNKTKGPNALTSNLDGRWMVDDADKIHPFVCRTPACLKDTFRCNNGKCINEEFKCDGVDDCMDNTDESNCPDHCSYYYKKSEGDVVSDGYSKNADCRWVIEGKPWEVMKIDFKRLDIEKDVDFVAVYAGGPTIETSYLLDTFSGDVAKPDKQLTLFSHNNYLIIELWSDATVAKDGIQAHFSAESSLNRGRVKDIKATSTIQELKSPAFSHGPRYMTTEWNIEAEEGELITLEITTRVERHLLLIESKGIEINIPDEERFVVISTDNHMRLVVKKEGMENKGFVAKVKAGCDVDIEASYLKVKTHKVPPNHECMWKITNSHDYKNAEYKILADEIMLANDSFIQMYNGSSMMEDSLVFSWNSSHGEIEEPRLIGHTGNTMLIVFHSGEMSNWHDEMDMVITTLCPPFKNQSHLMGSYTETSSSLNETYHKHFWCDKGYSFKQEGYGSNLTASCSPSGEWTFLNTTETRSPSCQDVYCGLPPMIENGFINSTDGSVKYKGEATYRCANGFSLQGSNKVSCEDDGHWTEAPTCKAESCGAYPSVDNAKVTFEYGDGGYGFGTIMKIECNPGYELVGAVFSVCQKNTQWSSTSSRCDKLKCPLPPIYKGKYNDVTLPLVGQTRVVTCDKGFKPFEHSPGSVIITCTENRTMSPEIVCIDINDCEKDGACSERQECVNHPGGKTCLCKPGHNGTNCDKIAADPYPHCTGGDSNKEPDCTCETGFELFTEDGQNGFFIPSPKEDGLKDGDVLRINRTCIRKTCNLPESGDSGPKLKSSKTHQYFEDVLEWHCPLHYQLSGSKVATCKSAGFNSPPDCTAMTCKMQTDMDNVGNRTWEHKKEDSYFGGTFATTKCKDPRAKEFDPFVRRTFCVSTPDSPWTYGYQGDSPLCPGLDCGKIELSGLDPTVKDYKSAVGSLVEIKCDSSRGFTLKGNSSFGQNQAKCGKFGRWDLGTMVCQGPRCKDPGTIFGTKQIAKDGYQMDMIVYYECVKSGYTPVPSTPLLCVYDSESGKAKWNDTAPTCFDKTKPVITCPNDMEFDLYDKITLELPSHSDNSKFVYMYQQSGPFVNINNITKRESITFRAYDHDQHSDCTVNVNIKDRSAPMFTCPDILKEEVNTTDTFFTELKNLNDFGENKTLVQTSPETVSLNIDNNRDQVITASITKDNGLMKECKFIYTVVGCVSSTLGSVTNGAIQNCKQEGSKHTCDVVCNDGFVLPNKKASDITTCDTQASLYRNTWTREPSFYNCHQTYAQIQSMSAKFYYTAESFIFGVFNECKAAFQNAVTDHINNLKGVCGGYTFSVIEPLINSEGVSQVSLTFTIRISNFDDNTTALQECRDKLFAGKTSYFQSSVSASSDVTTKCSYPWSIATEQQEYLRIEAPACDDRQEEITVGDKKRCVPCLSGYRWNSLSKSCDICEKLQYTSQPNQGTCSEVCDFDGGGLGSLASDGITGKDGCPDYCPKGFTSTTGFFKDKCLPCPENTYWKDSKTCEQCPNAGSTLGRSGADSIELCSDPCHDGQYSITGFKPCTPCPVNLYQPQKGQTECLECPGSKTTEGEGSTSESKCIEFACRDDCNKEGTKEGPCTLEHHTSSCICKPGYYGHKCENKIDPCSPNPCYGGTCKDNTTEAGVLSYACECYIDENCDFVIQPKLDFNKRDLIITDSGFTLVQCEKACKDSKTCKGIIYDAGSQFCFYFRTLDYLVGSNNTYGENSKEKRCSGDPLYSGERCEKDLRNDCKDDTCAHSDFCRDGIGGADCVCPSGVAYVDNKCKVASDPCSAVTCQNKGECVGFGDVRYHCNCPIGFTGDLCEINIDDCTETTCLHGGTCKDGDNGYECTCIGGFSGHNCEVLPNLCAEASCQGGDCIVTGYPNISAVCFCPDHYKRASEEEKDKCVMIEYCDSSPCANGAECIDLLGGYLCKCPVGFNGAQCQHDIDDCEGDPCQHGGVCHDRVHSFFCDCPIGFEGVKCEKNIDDCQDHCKNSATCEDLVMDYKCICQPGYGGKNCSEVLDLCDSAPCQHGGNCISTGVNSYRCACDASRTGGNCETEVDHCKGDCENDAKCYSLSDQSYFCRCKEGTAGDKCNDKTDMCELFNPFLCVHGDCENQNDGSAKCVCKGEVTSCAMKQHKQLKFRLGNLGEADVSRTLEDCKDKCLENDDCKSLIHSGGVCFLYKDVEETDTDGVYTYAGVKKCHFDPHYNGESCQFVKEMCHENMCGIDEDHMGMCSVDGFGFSCDCSNVDNYEGDRCQTPVEVCKESTCPSGAKCLPYMDQGKLTPACLCEPDEILAGSTCKEVDNNFDMMFPMEYKDDSLVTSVRGFVSSNVMTISMWIAFFEESDDWFMAIAKAGRKHDPDDDYEPLIKIYNDRIQLSYNEKMDIIPLKEKLSREHKWHLFSLSLNGEGQYQIVNDISTYGFDYDDHKPLNVTLPRDMYVYIHLGHGFSGYISQLHVWNSVVSIGTIQGMLENPLTVPDSSDLAMRWTMYEHDDDITPLYPSGVQHDTSVCKMPATDPMSVKHCPGGDDIPDKEPPKMIGTCEKEAWLVPLNGSNQVTLGKLNINFKDGIKSTNVPLNALSFGAHDVAVASIDPTGNVGVCMTRVYVTTNECSDTIPMETKPIDEDGNRKSVCYDHDLHPSIPTPYVFSCGKLRSYNLDDMFTPHYMIPCGEEDVLYVTLTTNLVYTVSISCVTIKLDDKFVEEMNKDILAVNKSGWHVCANNCEDMVVKAECNPKDDKQMLVQIILKDLTAMMGNGVKNTDVMFTPEELIKHLVNTDAFDAKSIASANLQKELSTCNSTFLCRFGYGRMKHACVECGPGSYYTDNPQLCHLCPIGEYSSESKMKTCTPCGEGKTTLQMGAMNKTHCVDKCPAGKFFNSTSNECELCPSGFYQNEAGQGFCKQCPPTKGTDGTGAVSVEDCRGFCPAGKELIERDCEDCKKGFYRIGNLQDRCKPCPENYTTSGEGHSDVSECNIPRCSPGFEIDDSGPMMKCKECDYGYYQSEEAKFNCEKCPDGYTTNHTKSVSRSDCIFACSAGKEVDGDESCSLCSRGYYKDDSMESRFEMCSPCPDMTFTTEGKGSVNKTECTVRRCFAGTYHNASDNMCHDCAIGTYQSFDQQDKCEKCKPDYSTMGKGSNSSEDCKFICKAGSEIDGTGAGCQDCPRGTYKTEEMRFESCKRCEKNTTAGLGSKSPDACKVAICNSGEVLSKDYSMCIPCDYDTYQPNAEPGISITCSECSGDSGTNHKGANSSDDCLKKCSEGQGLVDGECVSCSRGTWNNGNTTMRFEECAMCPDNTTTEVISGASSIEECKIPMCEAGQVIKDGVCKDCEIDTYQTIDKPFLSTKCKPCEGQTGTDHSGAVSAEDCMKSCIAGSGKVDEVCVLCDRGTWNNGNNTMRFEACATCTEGYTTSTEKGATKIEDCDLRDCKPGSFFNKDKGDECTQCPIGTYQHEPRQPNCIDCPINKNTSVPGADKKDDCLVYCAAGKEDNTNSECVPCKDDYFKSEASFGACSPCKGDLTSTSEDRMKCAKTFCDVGRYLEQSCTDCAKGFYKKVRGNAACQACPGNTTTEGTGSKSLDDCKVTHCEAGFFSPDGNDCMPCDKGFFKNDRGNDKCTECEGNFTTAGKASTDKAACNHPICPAGEFRSDLKCLKCPKGEYQPESGTTECKKCDKEFTTLQEGSTKKDQCRRVCPPGQFRKDVDNTCHDCPIGTYQTESGSTGCIKCSGNFTTFGTGISREEDCTVICTMGYRRTARDQCTACPVGKYQDKEGQEECKVCPNVDNLPSSTKQEASTKEEDCLPLCSQGEYLIIDKRSCAECPVGTYKNSIGLSTECDKCDKGTTTLSTKSKNAAACKYELCKKGFYRKLNEQDCQLCEYGTYQAQDESQATSCTPCKEGQTSLVLGATGDEYCLPECDDGEQYSQDQAKCTPCSIGQYRKKPELRCYFCPEGETTLSAGSSSCIKTNVPPKPVVKKNFKLKMSFKVKNCANLEHLQREVEAFIKAIFRKLAKRLRGLCSDDTCDNIKIKFNGRCGKGNRRKRDTSGTIEPDVELNNVDSQLTDILKNVKLDPETAIQDGLRDTTSENDQLTNNGLSPPSNIQISTTCTPGSILQGDGSTCVPCPKGEYYQTDSNTCVVAPKGTYTDTEGSISPKKCQDSMTTSAVRSNSSDDCNGVCAFEQNYCVKGECEEKSNGKKYCRCQSYYSGDKCDVYAGENRETDDNDTMVGGIAGGAGGVLLIIVIVVGCAVYRTRSSRSSTTKRNSETSDNVSIHEKKSHHSSLLGHHQPYLMNPMYSGGVQPTYVQDPTMYQAQQLDYYQPGYTNNGFEFGN